MGTERQEEFKRATIDDAQLDSPHQRLFEPVAVPVSARMPRIGDKKRTLEYETDQAMIDVLLQLDNRRPSRANVGHQAIKRDFLK
jgi:hypothetical protein